jgi:hypothetical protein
MYKPLDLPQAPRDIVFRLMEGIVRENAVFRRIVKPSSFRTWSGRPDDAELFTTGMAPAMRWTPVQGPETFWTPSTITSSLMINCEILLNGTNVSDVSNFWWMLVRCFYPAQLGLAQQIRQTLINSGGAGGAKSGLVMFSQPAFDPQPDGKWLAAQGQISIEVRTTIDP